MAEIDMLWLSCIEVWIAHLTSESLIAGWITEMLFMLFFACVDVYWAKQS